MCCGNTRYTFTFSYFHFKVSQHSRLVKGTNCLHAFLCTTTALMLELNKLNDEKRSLQLQLRTTTEKYERRVAELENAGEETERHYVELLEKKKLVVEDLQLQLDSVEKQLKSNRQFIEVRVQKGHRERVKRWKKPKIKWFFFVTSIQLKHCVKL